MDAYVLTLFNAYVSCLRLSSSQHKKEISHIGFVICAALYVIDSVHYPFYHQVELLFVYTAAGRSDRMHNP